MKIRLLLLLALLNSALSIGQINVGEGIEYGTPSGWTFPSVNSNFVNTYGTGCSGLYGLSTTVSSSNNYASVITTSYASNGNPISLSYYYKLESGTFSGSANIYYELNNSGTWTQAASSSDFSAGCKTLSADIAAGVVSNGATVKFKLQINWISGSGAISMDNILIYQAPVTSGLITEYNFDNTYSNINGLEPFGANAGTSFVPDRHAVNNNLTGAINLQNNVIGASINALCFGNSPRTISIWVKLNTYHASGFNYLVSYGQSTTGTAYGAYLNATTAVQFNVYPNQPVSTTNDLDVWYHYVFSYDGTNANIYKNGALLLSEARTWSNLNWNKEFNLGGGTNFNGAIDDLKLYNYALSQAEVTSLYTNNSLTAVPVVTNVSDTFTSNSATVNCIINPNGTLTNSVLNYGTSVSSLTNQVAGSTITTTNAESYYVSGLMPSTTYFYQVVATNSIGMSKSSVYSFTTLPSQSIVVAEYSFDNTYNNINGNSPFTASSGSSFVQDRNLVNNNAVNINATGLSAVIPNLPYGTSSRTVSLWVKLNTVSTYNFLYHFGTTSNGDGALLNASNIIAFSSSTNHTFASSNVINAWNHFVFVYDGTNSKIYKNGALLNTAVRNWNTVNNSDIFTLGLSESGLQNYFNGAIDDLKIYNYAITDADALSLFNNNSLSSTNFNTNNLKAALYPNPANDVLNIETDENIKLVEVYTLQGQKVLTSINKQVDVASLTTGIYLVKVIDENNAVGTYKIVKK